MSPVENLSPLGRLIKFKWLIFASLVSLFAVLLSFNLYVKNQKAEYEIEYQEYLIKRSNIERIEALSSHIDSLFVTRNSIEDVYSQIPGSSTYDELTTIYDELGTQIDELAVAIKEILSQEMVETASTKSMFNFQLMSVAVAQESTVLQEPQERSTFLIILSAAILVSTFFISYLVLIFSSDREKIKFAQTCIQSVLGFAVGCAAGPQILG